MKNPSQKVPMVNVNTRLFTAKALGIVKRLPLRQFRNWWHLLALLFLISILIWTFASKINTQNKGFVTASFEPNDNTIWEFAPGGEAQSYTLTPDSNYLLNSSLFCSMSSV